MTIYLTIENDSTSGITAFKKKGDAVAYAIKKNTKHRDNEHIVPCVVMEKIVY